MPVDQFIPLEDVSREAAKLRIMLDQGVGDGDQLYAAYNALLMVLEYGVQPPSEMWKTASFSRLTVSVSLLSVTVSMVEAAPRVTVRTCTPEISYAKRSTVAP